MGGREREERLEWMECNLGPDLLLNFGKLSTAHTLTPTHCGCDPLLEKGTLWQMMKLGE